MNNPSVYIKSATQISIQQPLCESWIQEPIVHEVPYVRCSDPSFRDWLSPMESRRMGNILRRAVVTASEAMRRSGVSQPDAIVTGTGLGCIDHTEAFLRQLYEEGEEMPRPTSFMQSTHNTISSLIAIRHHCHGYNATYSHKHLSFDSALLDAFIQLRLGDIQTALVTGNDEMPPTSFNILQRAGYVGQPGQVPASEASVAMMLTTDPDGSLCEIEDIRILTLPAAPPSFSEPLDAILMGLNGHAPHDEVYRALRQQLPAAPVLRYKHLFGECLSASALAIYAAAHILAAGTIPAHMSNSVRWHTPPLEGQGEVAPVRRLLVVHHSDGHQISLITLRR